MKKMIDIHSHMLPGVDDGCGSWEEALAMLRMYEEQDVEAVICTPHFDPCAVFGADVEGSFDRFRSVESPVRRYLGNEILLTRYTAQDVRRGLARTLAGSNWLLIEFEEWAYSTRREDILDGLRELTKTEYRIILAHPERYESLKHEPEFCQKITEAGVHLQVNAYDICENKNRATTEATQYLLENHLVSFLGSDAHGAEKRPPALQSGVQWIYDHLPEDYADAVVHDNAAGLILELGQ